jgi:hypothetical protein
MHGEQKSSTCKYYTHEYSLEYAERRLNLVRRTSIIYGNVVITVSYGC